MKTSIAIIGCCCAALHAQSADVTQFRGEGHLGAFPETGLLKAWPENGFKFTDGSGEHWCHPVIANKVLYIRRGDTLVAFDLKP